jgi:DNA-directed RNA polymerase specialized sigma24 family protein
MALTTRVIHDLDSPWPDFLDHMDRDPGRALGGLHTFAWKLFRVRPPAILRSLPEHDREDRIADLVLSCCRDDFRKLRQYQRVGKPFSAWLTVVFAHQIFDWIRSQRPWVEIPDSLQHPGVGQDHMLPPRVVHCLHRCLSRLSPKCQTYLACLADGMKPREIVLVLQLPKEDNKRVSDDLRNCAGRLRELLLQEGIDPEQVLSQ